MKRLEKLTLLSLLVILLFMGACSNNEWDEIPTPRSEERRVGKECL